MKNNAFIYGLVGFLIGTVVVWFLMFTTINANNAGMMRMMGFGNATRGVGMNSSTIDAHFIEQMIPHHEDAITMSELALTKAKRPEVKELAQNIIDSQSREIEQMKGWYKEWYGRDVPAGDDVMGEHGMMGSATQNSMHMGMMGNESDMTRLEDASDFDTAFVEEMIPHHQMAVMMANMLKNGTQRSEMKKLADDIITAQTNEIDQMRSWLNEWK